MINRVVIGGISKPFPKLKRQTIVIKLQSPITIGTMAVPSNYINVMIDSIKVDDYEILLGEICGQALSIGRSFADIAIGMIAKDSVTIVLRRLKSYNRPYAPFVVVSGDKAGRQNLRWKWKTFPTASRRKPLQFAVHGYKQST